MLRMVPGLSGSARARVDKPPVHPRVDKPAVAPERSMCISQDYRLLDFGDGRRLERFGEITLDRPCPAAERIQRADPVASTADARFEERDAEKGRWIERRALPERWIVAHGSLRFELKRTDFGHLGLFPEQAENWEWIARTVEGGRWKAEG